MSADPRIDERWYAPLVKPVLPAVASALRQLGPANDPWTMPRTGLGGAIVIHTARGFGLRRWRRAGRDAVVALEGYNQRVHTGEPDDGERSRWLERDIEWARRIWESALEKDDPVLRRVMDRLLGEDAMLADSTLPEAVLFLRAAVAAGVVIGDVPDPIHQALDRHVTWLGLSWEAQRGELTEAAWGGALRAVGVRDAFPGARAGELARERARAALEGLPESPVVKLLRDVLEHAPREGPAYRNPGTWEPMLAPMPTAVARPATAEGAYGAFADTWRDEVEAALESLSASGSESLGRASAYLLGQGGKRVRPMVTLAAARACGDSARRALPLAAAVEWLHQGSLVLDDIIDEASLRRGAPPLHAATSQAFAAGVAAYLFAKVLRALSGQHPEIRRHLVRAATTLAVGERLELERTGDPALPLTAYYKIIEAKTARLFSAAAATGALAAEAPAGPVRALVRYGREVGLAFQVVDDLLDYTGDERVLGKRPGTDLRAAKTTLPFILLRDALGAEERARLASALGHDASFPWVLGLLRAHGVAEACRERAQLHVTRAKDALRGFEDNEGTAALHGLADDLVSRTW